MRGFPPTPAGMTWMAQVDLNFSIEEDALISELLSAKGRRVDLIAFGIIYSGILSNVDIEDGTVVITDGEDSAVIEIERIESLSVSS